MRVNLLPYPLHLVAARDDRLARTEAVVGVALLHPVGSEQGDAEGTVGSEPMIDLLSDDIAQAKGSLVSALADEDRPQANRPSCPSTSSVISMSRTVGGLSGRTPG